VQGTWSALDAAHLVDSGMRVRKVMVRILVVYLVDSGMRVRKVMVRILVVYLLVIYTLGSLVSNYAPV